MLRTLSEKRKHGFSLLEVTLALGIAALVIASLGMIFKVSKQSWNVNTRRGEMLHHARIALGRISHDLRYATNLIYANFDAIRFDTTLLEDDNEATTERILYTVNGYTIMRTVDSGTSYLIAGDQSGSIQAQIQAVNPQKVDGSGDVVPVDFPGGDTYDNAIALRVVLRFTGDDGQSFEIRTQPTFRGKQ